MSRPATCTRTNHTAKARNLRANPGEWQHISTHRSPIGAQSAARRIDTGQLPAYRPEGEFEVRTVADCDTDRTAVEARYVGPVEERLRAVQARASLLDHIAPALPRLDGAR